MDPVRLDGPHVLLVDDQPDQLEMYRFALELARYSVVEAATGADAIAKAQRLQPRVIVLDLRLPDMTGWEVRAAIARDPATAHIPIVILTASASAAHRERAAQQGCAAYLVKPCFPEDLTQTVRQVLAAA